MTDDLVARLRREGDDEAVEALRFQEASIRRLERKVAAAEARARELEAMVSALNRDVHELGARISTIEAETIERSAKESETCWVAYTGRASDAELEQIDRARQDIAAAIRKLAQAK